MEVVLLWLDDLDDLVFSTALAWERLRRQLLQLGLTAACALATCELSSTATTWVPAFTGVAAASVTAWCLGAALRIAYYRELRSPPSAA